MSKSREQGMRAALYVRVSSDDQESANQLPELRQWAKRLSYKIVKVYTDDDVSGAREDRAAITDALTGAHRRDFDVLLVWALDRLSRGGALATLQCLKKFKVTGVRVKSLHDQFADFDGPFGEVIVAFAGWMAKVERQRIIARTNAGIARARLKGTKSGRPFGRPRISKEVEDAIREQLARGTGIHKTLKLVKAALKLKSLGAGTVQRIKAKLLRPARRRRRRLIAEIQEVHA